jgi:hypothetical protein
MPYLDVRIFNYTMIAESPIEVPSCSNLIQKKIHNYKVYIIHRGPSGKHVLDLCGNSGPQKRFRNGPVTP